jgi:hypothetical protein
MAAKGDGKGREILIEMQTVGNAVKVTAVDPATGIEASIVGDPRFGVETLKRNAARKLRYVMAKRQAAGKPSA